MKKAVSFILVSIWIFAACQACKPGEMSHESTTGFHITGVEAFQGETIEFEVSYTCSGEWKELLYQGQKPAGVMLLPVLTVRQDGVEKELHGLYLTPDKTYNGYVSETSGKIRYRSEVQGKWLPEKGKKYQMIFRAMVCYGEEIVTEVPYSFQGSAPVSFDKEVHYTEEARKDLKTPLGITVQRAEIRENEIHIQYQQRDSFPDLSNYGKPCKEVRIQVSALYEKANGSWQNLPVFWGKSIDMVKENQIGEAVFGLGAARFEDGKDYRVELKVRLSYGYEKDAEGRDWELYDIYSLGSYDMKR